MIRYCLDNNGGIQLQQSRGIELIYNVLLISIVGAVQNINLT